MCLLEPRLGVCSYSYHVQSSNSESLETHHTQPSKQGPIFQSPLTKVGVSAWCLSSRQSGDRRFSGPILARPRRLQDRQGSGRQNRLCLSTAHDLRRNRTQSLGSCFGPGRPRPPRSRLDLDSKPCLDEFPSETLQDPREAFATWRQANTRNAHHQGQRPFGWHMSCRRSFSKPKRKCYAETSIASTRESL